MPKRVVLAFIIVVAALHSSLGHTPGASLTWNKEISRVFYARCAECHRAGGSAFSLMSYPEVQPRLTDIKHAVLNRRMPPWGAVKGFGDFRNDQGLTQEEIELIADWIDADARKGNNPAQLPPTPKFSKPVAFAKPKNSIAVSGDLILDRPFILDGLYPDKVPHATDIRIVAEFPDSHVEPLLWLYEYKDSYRHPFLLRNPMELPAGTKLKGVPSGAQFSLLPGRRAR